MNPGNASPMMTPPPPPPPGKGGFPWKWVLIGCGTVTFLGLLVCGGCVFLGWNMSKDLIAAVKSLERNPKIEAEIGTYSIVEGSNTQTTNADQSITQTLKLRGDKGEGHVELKYKMEGMALKVLKKDFINDKTGTRISLD